MYLLPFESAGAPRQLWRSLYFKARHGPFGGFHAFHMGQSSSIGMSPAPLLQYVDGGGGYLQVSIAADGFFKGVMALYRLNHLQRSLNHSYVLLLMGSCSRITG